MKEAESWPFFDEDEIAAVTRVLRSGKVNRWTGEENRRFEEEFAEFVGAEHSIALANGTVSLEVALRCAGIGAGDDVIVTSRSFVASASAAVLVGARPIFADVDSESQNMTAETIRAVMTDRTRAVIAVHLGGWICDMESIMEIAGERDLIVIEDCAQALGAARDGRPAGTWGHVAAWSFCQDKLMTTGGEGGMLTTNDKSLWDWAWSFKDHGKSYSATNDSVPTPGFKWVHESIGSNIRMTEMQAAIGRVALPKVASRVKRRQEISGFLDDSLKTLSAIRTTVPPPNLSHSYYKYYAFVRPERLSPGLTRDDLLIELQRNGVPGYTGICPEIYRESAFSRAGFAPRSRHPVARLLGETSVMLPTHHNLSDETVEMWGRTVREVVERASG